MYYCSKLVATVGATEVGNFRINNTCRCKDTFEAETTLVKFADTEHTDDVFITYISSILPCDRKCGRTALYCTMYLEEMSGITLAASITLVAMAFFLSNKP